MRTCQAVGWMSILLVAAAWAGDTALPEAKNEQPASSVTAPDAKENPVVVIETSAGDMTLELWPDKAPKTVENFLAYTDEHFYDGLIFHRVIKGFMIQGGGFSPDMRQKATRAPIKNEAKPDVRNKRGTIAMARTMDVDSATSQFFINLVDNAFLDRGARDFGYCVFGQIVTGMDVLDKIGAVATGSRAGFSDVPAEPVTIRRVYRQAEAR